MKHEVNIVGCVGYKVDAGDVYLAAGFDCAEECIQRGFSRILVSADVTGCALGSWHAALIFRWTTAIYSGIDRGTSIR